MVFLERDFVRLGETFAQFLRGIGLTPTESCSRERKATTHTVNRCTGCGGEFTGTTTSFLLSRRVSSPLTRWRLIPAMSLIEEDD